MCDVRECHNGWKQKNTEKREEKTKTTNNHNKQKQKTYAQLNRKKSHSVMRGIGEIHAIPSESQALNEGQL